MSPSIHEVSFQKELRIGNIDQHVAEYLSLRGHKMPEGQLVPEPLSPLSTQVLLTAQLYRNTFPGPVLKGFFGDPIGYEANETQALGIHLLSNLIELAPHRVLLQQSLKFERPDSFIVQTQDDIPPIGLYYGVVSENGTYSERNIIPTLMGKLWDAMGWREQEEFFKAETSKSVYEYKEAHAMYALLLQTELMLPLEVIQTMAARNLDIAEFDQIITQLKSNNPVQQLYDGLSPEDEYFNYLLRKYVIATLLANVGAGSLSQADLESIKRGVPGYLAELAKERNVVLLVISVPKAKT